MNLNIYFYIVKQQLVKIHDSTKYSHKNRYCLFNDEM